MEVKKKAPGRAGETRETLLRHAREVFSELGYADASLDEIVGRADMTKGALYHHFEGKIDLYEGVVEEMAARLRAAVENTVEAGTDPWGRIEAMCDAYLDSCLDSDLARVLVLEAPTVLGWRRWCEIDREHAFGAFATALHEAMDGAEAADGTEGAGGSRDTSAQVVLGVLNTAAQVIATSPDPVSARAEVGGTVRRLLAGLRSTT